MNKLRQTIIYTNSINKPMNNWSRVVIESIEKDPKPIAVIKLAEGYRVRLKPYLFHLADQEDKKKENE